MSGVSVKQSFHQALDRAASVLGTTAFIVASELPKEGTFCGTVRVLGDNKNVSVRFDAVNGNYPTVL